MPSEMNNTSVAEGNGSSLPELPYIDCLEEKLAILKAISETEIPSETPNKPPRRIDQTGVKENVWAAFLVATVDELQQFLDFKVRSGRFFVETIETILLGVDFAVANVISIAYSKQATPSKRATSKSGVGSGVQSLLGKAKQKTRNQGSIDQKKAAAACKTSLYALGFIWGGNTWDKFKDALSIEDFDTPKNMITLGNAPHHLWDTGKITLSPVLCLPNRIDLAVRVLEPLDWSKRKGAGSQLPEGFATDPRIKMKGHIDPTDKITKKAAKQPVEVSFMSADTQYRINDGHLFTATSDDPSLLPSAALLELRDRIMVMMTLKEDADADDDVLSSACGGDDAQRILFGDEDVEINLEDKVLGWSERVGQELASLTTEEVNEMTWTSSVIQQQEDMGDMFPPEGQPED
ncbi:hypothetical protein K4K49_005779 [Colletotrichum sp. SAR 10_70]|nr:hypothetical protein KHU50_008434 [Colletotrichum sp. SAR 10_65]KAI8165523.1 hypothetical protein K4K49_005779 [Colletotrichum sp. SAR 10_70]KAI8167746.1 hypothetical protein K4K50_005440 [Colletotrichum sp. SAR 10_71]KAI8185958.1 hypothetical protein K4K51_011097 [Colletotrichum sp. SAR 10_75]KAI8209336.1 hypothetical protein K4K52_000471 [Colletotrichum sp. SAR 10_76]KAI8221142.1 hypothetical protein K4K54_008040 [Colletotrichum sp. SAR 10_86]KAJ4996541.1 hypothetical protein K4K48_00834